MQWLVVTGAGDKEVWQSKCVNKEDIEASQIVSWSNPV